VGRQRRRSQLRAGSGTTAARGLFALVSRRRQGRGQFPPSRDASWRSGGGFRSAVVPAGEVRLLVGCRGYRIVRSCSLAARRPRRSLSAF